jgi:hypothetical protein
MTVAPAFSSSMHCLPLIPLPPAAFSPLTMVKSAANSSCNPFSRWPSALRPGSPTTSPKKSIRIILSR